MHGISLVRQAAGSLVERGGPTILPVFNRGYDIFGKLRTIGKHDETMTKTPTASRTRKAANTHNYIGVANARHRRPARSAIARYDFLCAHGPGLFLCLLQWSLRDKRGERREEDQVEKNKKAYA